jgi:hypothetical protein
MPARNVRRRTLAWTGCNCVPYGLWVFDLAQGNVGSAQSAILLADWHGSLMIGCCSSAGYGRAPSPPAPAARPTPRGAGSPGARLRGHTKRWRVFGRRRGSGSERAARTCGGGRTTKIN